MDLDSKRSNIKALYFDAHPHKKKSYQTKKELFQSKFFFLQSVK